MRTTRLIHILFASLCLVAGDAQAQAEAKTGRPPVGGQQGILLAQIGPFTGYPVPYGREVNEGIKACLAQLNSTGGVRGQKISFLEFDDRYTGDGFAEQFHKAMEKRPVALLSPVGSDALKRMLQNKLLDSQEVVVVNAVPGAEAFRTPGHPMLFHIRAGDKQQIEKIVKHVRTLGMTRLAVLYQDLAIGISGAQVAQAEATRLTGLELTAINALLGNEIQLLASEISAAIPLQPKVKIVAVMGDKRSPQLPDVPTTKELGYPGVVASSMYGIIAPTKTPAAITDKFRAAVHKALAQPEVRDRLVSQGQVPTPTSGEEYRKLMADESAKWAVVIKNRKITFD